MGHSLFHLFCHSRDLLLTPCSFSRIDGSHLYEYFVLHVLVEGLSLRPSLIITCSLFSSLDNCCVSKAHSLQFLQILQVGGGLTPNCSEVKKVNGWFKRYLESSHVCYLHLNTQSCLCTDQQSTNNLSCSKVTLIKYKTLI